MTTIVVCDCRCDRRAVALQLFVLWLISFTQTERQNEHLLSFCKGGNYLRRSTGWRCIYQHHNIYFSYGLNMFFKIPAGRNDQTVQRTKKNFNILIKNIETYEKIQLINKLIWYFLSNCNLFCWRQSSLIWVG